MRSRTGAARARPAIFAQTMSADHDRHAAAPARALILDCIYYAVAIFFFLYLFVYFWTSEGGPTLLAMTLVPVTFVLFVLNALRENDLYPRLPPAANYAIAAIYIVLRARRRLLHAHRVLRARHVARRRLGSRPTCSWAG